MRVFLVSLIMSLLFSIGIWNDAHIHRTGFLLIEVATVTITEDEGGGKLGGYDDAKGWYSAYSANAEFQLQDRALSVYLYNPLNNELDDIIWRYDWLIEKGGTKRGATCD